MPRKQDRGRKFLKLYKYFWQTLYLFADDANIYVESETISELVHIVKKELKLVTNGIDANLLSLYISKTNYIIFHSPAMSIPADIVIKIGRDHIDRSRY